MTLARGYSTRTSGDLTADRRYAYGDGALGDADFAAAQDLFRQTIELVPAWPPAHFALAKACLGAGDRAAAIASLQRVLALDPDDRLGASVLIGQIEGGHARMPDAYVAALFDEYAPRFDSHLVDALDYRAPALLAAVLQSTAPGRAPFLRLADLGCGTGLMARALAEARLVDDSSAIDGVDLSAGMLRVAAAEGRYRRLACAELGGFLNQQADGAFDLVIAADVFCYVPDLAPVFTATRRVLSPGGLFAFSIQTHDETGYRIGADARVHHAASCIRAWAEAVELNELAFEDVSTRKDRGQPVPGALFVLAKP